MADIGIAPEEAVEPKPGAVAADFFEAVELIFKTD
jgi:hypothetical protein